jgi:membrane-bound acyltransferase YfiQ involved in biofilm formation
VNTIVGGSTNTPTDLLLLGIDQSSATDNEKVKAFSQRFLKNILLSAIRPIIITIMTVLTTTRTVIFERALKKSSLIKISEESFNYTLWYHTKKTYD